MTSSDDAVAVITDIHANLPALEAALARIDQLVLARRDRVRLAHGASISRAPVTTH